MSALQFTPLGRDDLSTVAAFHAPFTRRRSNPALLHWQFFDDALPADGILIGAWDGDRLVGTQAFIPITARVGRDTVLSAKSELTLVHPDYRGRGVFEGMYALGFQHCTAKGIACIWGFTSAVKPFRAVGFETLGPLYNEYIVLRPLRFALARRFPAPLLAAATHKIPQHPWLGEGEEDLATYAATGGAAPFTIERNTDWLRYRYERNPWLLVTGVDEENGLLYTHDPARTDVIRISELGGPGALEASLRNYIPRQPASWKALYRFTNNPLPSRFVGKRAVTLHRPSKAHMVWTWLGTHAGRPLPAVRIEDGYREGV